MQNTFVESDHEKKQLIDSVAAEIDDMKGKLLNLIDGIPNSGSPGFSEFTTPKNAAKLLGISMPTLHRYSEQGLLEKYRLGNKTYYKYNDLIKSIKLENGGF